MHLRCPCPAWLVLIVVLGGRSLAGQEKVTPRWEAPPLDRSISVRDGRSDKILSLEQMLDLVATADVVFLGETHTDETTHRVERAVYEGLLARRKGRVTLAMEMFERDVQATLDAYLRGEIEESAFLKQARPWENYRAAYRPLIEKAKQSKSPVIASNFPRPLRMRLAAEGPQILQALEGDAKQQAPERLLPNTDAYWRRVDNAIRGHAGMMREGDRLHSTQSLWDNAMGDACAQALDKYAGNSVLHVNGDFHSQYWDGIVHQLRQRKPDAKVKTISVVPTGNPATSELRGAPASDFVVFAEARAADLNDGTWSVHTQREIKYLLHLPAGASTEQRVPLLIWFVDDGLTASDGMDLWMSRLGPDAALVVVEPPYRELQADLGIGGRWFWADSFSSDMGMSIDAVEKIWGYVARHYPIDPRRVCLAGEGTGGTVAAAAALLTERIDTAAIAYRPRQYAKLKDFPLPLPEAWGKETPPQRSLTVIAAKSDEEWWTGELKSYQDVGLTTAAQTDEADPWKRELQLANALRQGLGLAPVPEAKTQDKGYLLLDNDAPRARQWARMQALWSAARNQTRVAVVDVPPPDATVERVSTEIRPENFAAPDGLPRCPGPFGGTTVLVLPAETSDPQLRDWLALAENDPLAKQSRFHRVRIATTPSANAASDSAKQHSFPAVLAKLQSENRKNVLVVPAVFFADATWMQSLKRSVRSVENQMTLQWLPGLGGSKSALVTQTDPNSEPPLQHELNVTLDPKNHRIVVEDKIQLPPSLRRAGAAFALNGALTLASSTTPVTKQEPDAQSSAARYVLTQPVPEGVLTLRYEGAMDFGLSDQIEEYTRGFRQTRGVVREEGVYLDGDSDWVPKFDDRLIRFALHVVLPAEWHVISQGKGTSRDGDGGAHWQAEGPMDQVYLVGGPLHRETDAAGGVEVQVYLRQRDDGLTRKYLDTGARYIEMYRGLIGPYPYAKFALVENFWETGYGMPSFTLLGPQVIRFPFILHSSYPHEILHNWWGNSVFVDYEQGNWCEGLTAYMADHLIQEQRGTGAEYRRNALQKYRDYVREGRDFPLSEFRSRHNAATEAVGYGKALMMFHMLRRELGDEAFRAGLASFYRKQRGQRAAFNDLRSAFESAKETQLGPFFAQWVNRKGAPQLAVRDVAVRADQGEFLVTGSLDQSQVDEPYALRVPITVQTEAGPKYLVVETNSRQHALEIRVPDRPLTLSVDPLFDLFRQLDPRETPPTIGQIFGQPRILAVLPTAAAEASRLEPYRELISSWRSDDHAIDVVLDSELKALPDDRAVWILGKENRFAGLLFADDSNLLRVEDGAALQLAGERVPFADHSLVVVRRHPRQAEQAIGWLTVDPAGAFGGMARKLPHYGKYSYLAFEGTEPTNTVKGQWDTSGSPLVVDLRKDRSEQLVAPVPEPRKALAELPPVFSSRTLVEHVEWLSAPEREGRGLGSAGIAQSAEYIAKAMADAGLTPGGDDGTWFQKFTVAKGADGRPVETRNVIGILPGKRADWSEQSIVLSAHYDHLGRGWPDVHAGDEGKIHPGADDNASGVAVMLELARILAAEGGGPRNLVVIAFSAEEANRLGSRHYVDHPRFPLKEVRGVINLDAVGRLRDQPLSILGTGTADEWQHVFRGCTFVTGIPSKNIPEAASGSDQLSFIERGIPGVQIFTGMHGDYHRPTDTPDKVDPAGLVKVATFVKESVTYMLDREPPLTVRISGQTPPAAASGDGGRRVLFGAVPAFEYQGMGVKLESVVPDSPAASAGLKAGDILVRLDTEKIGDLQAFSNFLKKLKPDQQVTAVVRRDGQELTIKVTVKKR